MLSISSSAMQSYTVANEKGWLAMPTVGIYATKHEMSSVTIGLYSPATIISCHLWWHALYDISLHILTTAMVIDQGMIRCGDDFTFLTL